MTIEITKGLSNIELTRGIYQVSLSRGNNRVEVSKGDNEVGVSRPSVEVGVTKNDDDSCDILLETSPSPEINLEQSNLDLTITKEELHADISRHSHLLEIAKDNPEFLLQLQPGVFSSTSANYKVECYCDSSDSLGDCVYVYGEQIDNRYQVRKVDITTLSKMPVYGVIIKKITSVLALVQWFGNVVSVYTGLEPRKVMFVGYDGRPTHIPPVKTVDYLLQIIGISLDSSTLFISPERQMIQLRIS